MEWQNQLWDFLGWPDNWRNISITLIDRDKCGECPAFRTLRSLDFARDFSSGLRRPLSASPLRRLGQVRGFGLIVGYALVFSICSACLREVSVSLAPLSMRATSSVRSSPVMRRTAVRVRSAVLFFSIR